MNFRKLHIILTLFGVTVLAACDNDLNLDRPGNLVTKTVDQDASLPSITVNGVKLHAEAFGNPANTIIVALHGGPGSDYRYMLNCQQLSNYGYRVVFYDQRGSGLSQRFSKSSYSKSVDVAMQQMYDDLSGVISHYRTSQNQKIFLLGHSWGGILATAYANKYPNAIQGLVVCEPGGLVWDDIVDYVERSRSFNLWGELLNDITYLDQFITGKENQHEIVDYKLATSGAKNEITGEDNTLPNSFWRPGAVVSNSFFLLGEKDKPNFTANLNNFTVPVLFLHSEKNKAYPLSWAQRVSKPYSSHELFKVNGGHSDMIVNEAIWTTTTLPRLLQYFNSL